MLWLQNACATDDTLNISITNTTQEDVKIGMKYFFESNQWCAPHITRQDLLAGRYKQTKEDTLKAGQTKTIVFQSFKNDCNKKLWLSILKGKEVLFHTKSLTPISKSYKFSYDPMNKTYNLSALEE